MQLYANCQQMHQCFINSECIEAASFWARFHNGALHIWCSGRLKYLFQTFHKFDVTFLFNFWTPVHISGLYNLEGCLCGQCSWLQNGDVLFPVRYELNLCYVEESRPPLWFSGQSSWLQNGYVLFPVRYELNLCYVEESRPPLWSEFFATDPVARVRFPALPEKKSSESGTGSTQPREYNWGATWKKSSGSCLENR
jgi:hypothetical protein